MEPHSQDESVRRLLRDGPGFELAAVEFRLERPDCDDAGKGNSVAQQSRKRRLRVATTTRRARDVPYAVLPNQLFPPMPFVRALGFVVLGWIVLASLAVAQPATVTTVDGPAVGQQTTMSATPHPVTDALSIRAIGVAGRRDTTMWSFALIGADDLQSVAFHVGGTTFAPPSTSDANDAGPVSVSVTKEQFLTLLQAPGAAMSVNGTRFALPEALQADMKAIFESVL